MIYRPNFFLFLLISPNIYYVLVQCTLQGEEVGKWANTIGDELWRLGKEVTKITEIEQKYEFLNAEVGAKDPTSLLKEVKENILRMMDRKMDAIRCIQQEAEYQAETFKYDPNVTYAYYSSRWSQVNGSEEVELPKSLQNNSDQYLLLTLNNDTHFYNLPVNTNHSSVYVTTNVYDKEQNVIEAIQWSEALDKIFRQNYKSDPALSWQYFGSSSGIMRHYPAMHWVEKDRRDVKKDVFDCRIRTWFIEAATCTKDVIILIDNSGSMDGMGKHIGKLIAYSILDTFSNNDYVNVLNYSDSKSSYTVPCFANQLIQATKENIRVFKEVIEKLVPSGKTTLEPALIEAFELLNKYRDIRGCNSENNTNNEISQLCNQAIMILTDGVNGNYTDLIKKYNHLYDGNIIPVRIFTYLIGQELENVEEIKWMSCANKGYYTQVATLEQVTASVLQYIYVIARPLVLQAEDHPVSWTHAYADITYDDKTDTTINEPYRLLTSAAIPCYDTKINKQNDSVTAELLGIAGTDVPIDEFRKLTRPYKIGVNAYAFIVSNNGYVLMHPALRPVYRGLEKENYNSIDLTEVEQHYDDTQPREISETVKQLRAGLVNAVEGSLHNVILKYHYDDNRRVSEETYDYYYTALTNTPFSLALAIPNLYGNYSLDVGDQIQKNRHTGENLTSFFKGKWRVHPKWVYCRYHYLEGHEFKTPEDEIIHFLGKMYSGDFKWELQYEPLESEDIDKIECGRKTLEDDDYYCDKELVQRLIFDARNTYEPFKEKWTFQSDRERQSFDKYNVSLRFVATMSGLTRWDYIHEEYEKNIKKSKEFGDLNPRAIDEKWYKSAVLQHQYDTDSFVYSVPFNYELSNLTEALVTGSYAIFVKNAGIKAPGSVVGFQFNQTKFKQSVKEVSKKLSNQCSNCDSCATNLICYIIDSSGYIIVDIENDNIGRFIGELEGDLMETMLAEKIFIMKTFYDYQALCERSNDTDSSGSILQGPVFFIRSTIKWILMKILYTLTEVSLYQIFEPVVTMAQDIIGNGNFSAVNSTEKLIKKENNTADLFYACENKIDLFILQQSLFIRDNFHGELSTSEKRKFYMKRIPNSNLMFLAAEKFKPFKKPRYTTDPVRISKIPRYTYEEMNTTLLPCQKLYLNSLERRRLSGCYNDHPLEREIKACGKTESIKLSFVLFFISSIISIYNF
ncbi:voltage-dependent calcium channel subunit alpha-2/delta-3 [Anthonomus grandis grandis]|uniref:voltage-dependent calcium channel subunit alpha-2/delta-3 n=1 Tax=Anthonomus grandis grandis TaxID=2921223 RepID=UPI0021663C43|nr:voltage-dependent calcium channel subunit alpha-2/delta-3 [Anthonomus grandis grandis]